MIVASLTDVGMKRAHNEDNFLSAGFSLYEEDWKQNFQILVVSDGMGGAAAGEVAAKLTIEMVGRRIYSGVIDKYLGREQSFVNPGKIVKEAVQAANRRVYYSARTTQLYAGMGATVTAALVIGGGITIGHVGDSRCYWFRRGRLRQLTTDHSFVNELVREGRITPEQAAKHPRRNVITRAIGSRKEVVVDIYSAVFDAGDVFLFCSDGLSGMISDSRISSILNRLVGHVLTQELLAEACHTLVAQANLAGGKDNISVVLAGVESSDIPVPRVKPTPIRPRAVLTWDEALQEGMADESFVTVFGD